MKPKKKEHYPLVIAGRNSQVLVREELRIAVIFF